MSEQGPAEVFAALRAAGEARDINAFADLMAEDGVISWPFALPGRPERIQGRAAIREFFAEAVAGLPARTVEYRDVVVHQSIDPAVAVIEYTARQTRTETGERHDLPFVVVLTVRDGLIAEYRDYMNVAALTTAMR